MSTRGWKLSSKQIRTRLIPRKFVQYQSPSLTNQPTDDMDRAEPASIDDEDDSDGDSAWSEESEDQSDE